MAKRGRASKDEVQFIQDNRGKMEVAAMAEKLDRTENFVIGVLKKDSSEKDADTNTAEKIVQDRKKVVRSPIQAQMNPEDGPAGVTIMTPAVSAMADELPKTTGFKSRYAKNIREVRK